MTKLILISLLAIVCFACTGRPADKKETTPELLASTTTDTNYVEVVKQYFMYFNHHDWKSMAEMYSDTAEFKDPSLGQEIMNMNHTQVVSKYTELEGMFPDVNDVIKETYPSGKNVVVVEFVSSGTGEDGTTFELPICTIFTFEKGKIIKDYTYYDNF